MSKKSAESVYELLKEALIPIEEQPYEVPENWVWTNIGAVAQEIKNGTTLTQNKEAIGQRVTRIESIQNNNVEMKRLGFISEIDKIKDNDYYEEGDIALSHINSIEHVGKTTLISDSYLPLVHGMNLLRIRLHKSLINPKYGQYFMRSNVFRKAIWDRVNHSVNQVSLNQKKLREVPFPLPPLNEQKRIADKVERFLDKINQAKQLIEEAKETFELRRAAILDKAFRGELTEKWRKEHKSLISDTCSITDSGFTNDELPYILPDGWRWSRLKDLGTLDRGKSKHRPRNDPKLFGGTYPFIQTGDVAKAGNYIENYSQTLSEIGLMQSKLFPENTVCITIAANIADTAILKFPCCFPDSVVGFIPHESGISSEYLHYYMRTIKSNLEHYAPATAQKNINLKVLSGILVPVPPKTEHDKILDALSLLLINEEQAYSTMNIVTELETLKQSILRKAFHGELGTNDLMEDNTFTELPAITNK